MRGSFKFQETSNFKQVRFNEGSLIFRESLNLKQVRFNEGKLEISRIFKFKAGNDEY
jgi:hypothetical protein